MSKFVLNTIVYRLVLTNASIFTAEELDLIEAELCRAISRRDDTTVDGHSVTDILCCITRHHNNKLLQAWAPCAVISETGSDDLFRSLQFGNHHNNKLLQAWAPCAVISETGSDDLFRSLQFGNHHNNKLLQAWAPCAVISE